MQKPRHFFNLCMLVVVFTSFFVEPFKSQNEKGLKVNVGMIVDRDTTGGIMMHTCMLMALEDFYATHNIYTTRIVPHSRDSKSDVVAAASAAIDLLKNVQVHAILGPQRSTQADFVIDVGNKVEVPILSLATDPSLSPQESPYFVRGGMSSSFQSKAIAAMIKAFDWKEVVIIYEDDGYGSGFVPYFIDSMREIDTSVKDRMVISRSWTDEKILLALRDLKDNPTTVFVVHMLPPLSSRFFSKANEAGMMSKGYAWIITDLLTSLLGSMDESVIESMQGVLGLRPHIPRTQELQNFNRRWRKRFHQENPDLERFELSALGLWAYDSTTALAMAVETIGMAGTNRLKFKRPVNSENLTDLDAIGTSEIGHLLIKSLRNITFWGLSGNFSIINGQLEPSAFKIVNVIGKGERGIGYWSTSSGISNKLKPSGETDKDDLGAITWPGESSIVPKGWELPVPSKEKLKIAVPVSKGFFEFLDARKGSKTGPINPTGFCIDVFNEVMTALPYAAPYEFYAYDPQSYNDLVNLVAREEYDAVVGDVTILANRARYVDFTLPYTDSGVAILVPIKTDERKNPWIFLKPLKMDLWLTIFSFFIFIGFVIWVLEHRVNKEFRGPPYRQFGMIFWFSFSTLVFAHKEKVVSNLSRFVVIVWIFVVVVLTSSYQASLTSMLTLQKLQPMVANIDDLKKYGGPVGYQTDSFVPEILKKMNFDSSKFRNYSTVEDYDDALSKGSKNGGVAAIIDELPYIRIFLAKHPKKYTIIGHIYSTSGFGFVFPKGSSLGRDVSIAVLDVMEGEKIVDISRKWFGGEDHYLEEDRNDADLGSLTLSSFGGLFLVAGIAASIALMLFLFNFLRENQHILASEDSLLQKLSKIAKTFNEEKENSSRESKEPIEPVDGDTTATTNVLSTGIMISDYMQNPAISVSNHAEVLFSQDEGFSMTEPRSPVRDAILTP